MKNFFDSLKDVQGKRDAAAYVSGWLDKVSVGCLIVGMFQQDHGIGGTIAAAVFFLAGLILKVRRIQ